MKQRSEALAPDAAEFKTGFAKWLPLIVLSTAIMIIIIDTTVLNVSLRSIVTDLNTDLKGLQWVITGYALVLAALTITGGRLGDLFGRKKMFMLGAVIFAVGSFITSISHSIGMMLVGESVIEGIGAAMMLPATASLLVANYQGRDRAIAFGVWGGIAGAASAIGPILGGFLTTSFSWRWAFRINIGIALLLLLGATVIAESRDRAEKQELDFVGVGLSSVGMLAFVYGIIESANYGWWQAKQVYSIFGHQLGLGGLSITPVAMAVGAALLVGFALWERRIEAKGHTPLVSLKLFRNKQFTSGASTVALMSLGMTGTIFALPVFFQSVQNLDALHTGYALAPMSVALLIVAPASAALAKRFTAKQMIQTGLLIATAGSLLLRYLIGPEATALDIAPGLVVFGSGLGLVFAQASNLTLSAVSIEQAGEASGVNNTLRQVGSTLGSAIIGAVVLGTLSTSLASGVTKSSVIPDQMKPALAQSVASQASSIELSGTDSQEGVAQLSPEIKQELTHIAHQASADGGRKAMLYTGLFLAMAFGVSFFLPNVRDLDAHANSTAAPAAH
jgi:EmrB/QacA subfamily drug resistance transporter